VLPPSQSSPTNVSDVPGDTSNLKKLFTTMGDKPVFLTHDRSQARRLVEALNLSYEKGGTRTTSFSAAYTTYDRSKGQSLVSSLKKHLDVEKNQTGISKPYPALSTIFSLDNLKTLDLESETSTESNHSLDPTNETKDSDKNEIKTESKLEAEVFSEEGVNDEEIRDIPAVPTLIPATVSQKVRRALLFPKYMVRDALPAVLEAVGIMLRDLRKNDWKPSRVFETNDPLALSSSKSFAGKKSPGYSAQLTFTKKFDDRERFEKVFHQLCVDSGMEASMGTIVWNDGVSLLNEFKPSFTDVPGTHYIPNSRSYYAEGGRFKKFHIAIDMYESDQTTIMQAHLPGRAWDGTSCFNFVKELVNRYHSDDAEAEKSPVFKASDLIKMTDDSREKFDNWFNILRWASLVPYNVYSNQSGLCWQKASAEAGIDGYKEIPKELCHVNFSDVQSKKLAAALKRHSSSCARGNVAPTAALVFAGVHAFNFELGEYPFSVVMQASMQTRCFEPSQPSFFSSFKERRFVGDWLIGVLHRVRTWGRLFGLSTYKVDDAQQFYESLVDGLATTDSSVRDGFYSRVLGKLKGGAAAFEKTPCFPGNSRLNDSLFFNNYGVRTIHEDSGCVGFNWSGAGKVGINCILVNGRLCCSIASTQLPLKKVEEIRDTFKEILLGMMEGKDGNMVVERIQKDRMTR